MVYRKLFLLPNSKAERRKAAQEEIPDEVKQAGAIQDGVISLPPVATVILDNHSVEEDKSRLMDVCAVSLWTFR